jgi:subtilisin-like proprotein convertase family protein
VAAYDRLLAAVPAGDGDDVPHGAAVARVVANALDGTLLAGLKPAPVAISYAHDALATSFAEALARQDEADVVTASCGVGRAFGDDFASPDFAEAGQALREAVASGRDGLGTIVVFAAGNARQLGDNVNHHNFQNAPETIAVGALDADGHAAAYSTPGAAVLVSAVGSDVPLGPPDAPDHGAAGAADGPTVTGTSFAAPKVSAAVARMLEANPALSHRDVQEILARSATPVEARPAADTAPPDPQDGPAPAPDWLGTANGARDWNGGGLLFDPRVGFGGLDADAAVRLAAAWSPRAPGEAPAAVSVSAQPSAAIPDGAAPLSVPLTLAPGVEIEQVSLQIDISHRWIGDLTVTLVSPSGTRSVLLDRPGLAPEGGGHGSSADDVDFTLTSNAFRGEAAGGTWRVEVADAESGFAGTLNAATLHAAGRAESADDTHVYTDAFAQLATADPERATLADTDGSDHLLAAALSQDATIDLTPGATSLIAGRALQLLSTTAIEAATGGAGNDAIIGNLLDNRLVGGGGADALRGQAGSDTPDGGHGDDWLHGGAGADTFEVSPGSDTIADFDPWQGDRLALPDGGAGAADGPPDVRVTPTETGVELAFDDGARVRIEGIDTFDADWFIA